MSLEKNNLQLGYKNFRHEKNSKFKNYSRIEQKKNVKNQQEEKVNFPLQMNK